MLKGERMRAYTDDHTGRELVVMLMTNTPTQRLELERMYTLTDPRPDPAQNRER